MPADADKGPKTDALRQQIAALVQEYYREQFSRRTFQAGTDLVHYAGRVFDANELCNLVDASLELCLAVGCHILTLTRRATSL